MYVHTYYVPSVPLLDLPAVVDPRRAHRGGEDGRGEVGHHQPFVHLCMCMSSAFCAFVYVYVYVFVISLSCMCVYVYALVLMIRIRGAPSWSQRRKEQTIQTIQHSIAKHTCDDTHLAANRSSVMPGGFRTTLYRNTCLAPPIPPPPSGATAAAAVSPPLPSHSATPAAPRRITSSLFSPSSRPSTNPHASRAGVASGSISVGEEEWSRSLMCSCRCGGWHVYRRA